MKIRMLYGITGSCDGVALPDPGGVCDIPDRSAAHFIERGFAVEVTDDAEASAPEGDEEATEATDAEAVAEGDAAAADEPDSDAAEADAGPVEAPAPAKRQARKKA